MTELFLRCKAGEADGRPGCDACERGFVSAGVVVEMVTAMLAGLGKTQQRYVKFRGTSRKPLRHGGLAGPSSSCRAASG